MPPRPPAWPYSGRTVAVAGKPYTCHLTASANGYWRKKLRGKTHTFGRVGDKPEDVLARFLAGWPAIVLGAPAQPVAGSGVGVPLGDALDDYLARQEARVGAAIEKHTFYGVRDACRLLLLAIDHQRPVASVGPHDAPAVQAALESSCKSPVTRRKTIGVMRRVERAMENRWGASWGLAAALAQPSARQVRLHQNSRPPKLYTPAECRALLDAARDAHERLALLLALNCGLRGSDAVALRMSSVADGVLDQLREKTAARQTAPLWPETLAAIEDAGPHDRARLLEPWKTASAISQRFPPWRKRAGVGGQFAWLRETMASACAHVADDAARKRVMGHVAPDAVHFGYLKHADMMPRLRSITDAVRGWLWGEN